jgi:pantothenate synthetase
MALSSRNAYLTAEDRSQGLALSTVLRAADAAWRGGEQEAAKLVALMQDQFRKFPGIKPDYVEAVDSDSLRPVSSAGAGTILTVAGRVGQTRLLDNHILGRVFA